MSKYLLNNDSLSVCHKDNCVHAKGDNAKLIATGIFAMLILFGISKLVSSN